MFYVTNKAIGTKRIKRKTWTNFGLGTKNIRIKMNCILVKIRTREKKNCVQSFVRQELTSTTKPCLKLLNTPILLAVEKFVWVCFMLLKYIHVHVHPQSKQTEIVNIVYRSIGTCGNFVMDERASISASVRLLFFFFYL